eukprot:gene2619-1617_t
MQGRINIKRKHAPEVTIPQPQHKNTHLMHPPVAQSKPPPSTKSITTSTQQIYSPAAQIRSLPEYSYINQTLPTVVPEFIKWKYVQQCCTYETTPNKQLTCPNNTTITVTHNQRKQRIYCGTTNKHIQCTITPNTIKYTTKANKHPSRNNTSCTHTVSHYTKTANLQNPPTACSINQLSQTTHNNSQSYKYSQKRYKNPQHQGHNAEVNQQLIEANICCVQSKANIANLPQYAVIYILHHTQQPEASSNTVQSLITSKVILCNTHKTIRASNKN